MKRRAPSAHRALRLFKDYANELHKISKDMLILHIPGKAYTVVKTEQGWDRTYYNNFEHDVYIVGATKFNTAKDAILHMMCALQRVNAPRNVKLSDRTIAHFNEGVGA